MKIVSSYIQHKTDVGGLVLNVDNLELARTSYQDIFKNVKNTVPNAKIDGIMISPMKRGDLECSLGAKIDPVFGPIVMFGLGGIYAEVMKDIVFAEAPVNKEKAEQMILSLKSKDIFYGARGKPPVNINSLLNAIVVMQELLYFKNIYYQNLLVQKSNISFCLRNYLKKPTYQKFIQNF